MRRLIPASLVVLVVSALIVGTGLLRPQPAPGEMLIAFVSTRDGNYDLYYVDPDSPKTTERASKTIATERDVALSPDGTRIAYASNATGDYEIYVRELKLGSKELRITNNTAADLHPTWSPDGRSIAFQSNRSGVLTYVYVTAADGSGGARRLTASKAPEAEPDWSRTGLIAFTQTDGRNRNIAYADARGTITSVIATANTEFEAAWSPDGLRLAFTMDVSGNRDIWVIAGAATRGNPDFSRSRPERLTTHAEPDAGADWSPDGKRIAWTGIRSKNSDVWVMNADGSRAVQIATSRSADLSPSWGANRLTQPTSTPTPAATPTPTATPTPVPTATPTSALSPTPTPTTSSTSSGGGGGSGGSIGTDTPLFPPINDPAVVVGATLQASDGTYLGLLVPATESDDSVCAAAGPYGSHFSLTSVNNDGGPYGSPFGSQSAFNPAATDPPRIMLDGQLVGWLSTSPFLTNAVDPNDLLPTLGCV